MNNLDNSGLFSRVLNFFIGDGHRLSFHRIHHTVLILTFLFYLIGGTFNICFLDLNYFYNIAFMTLGVTQAVMWYYSRFKGYFKSMAVLYIVVLYLVAIPANWFFNAGSLGPTFVFIYIAVIYAVVILREIGYFNLLAITLMLGLPVCLLVCEYHFPDSVSFYHSRIQRLGDLVLSNVAALVIIIIIVATYTRTLKREIRRANRYSRQLRIISETDSLTRLKNRAYAVNALELAEKVNKSFNVILLDIDHFKKINDTYGHDIGDLVLKNVSEILKTHSRANGALISRYGGEEFLIVTFFQTFEETVHLAESVRAAVCAIDCAPSEKVTVSLGVACSQQDKNHQKVIKLADKALYESKHLGRNRVSVLEV